MKIIVALLKLLKRVQARFFCNRYFCHIIRGCLPFRLPERLYRHLYFEGSFTVNLPDGVHCKVWHPGNRIENGLFWEGFERAWEAKSLDLWCRLSRTSYEILDIGANTGLYSIFAKAQNPHARIHSFEPNQTYLPAFKKSCNLNSFDIAIHEFALGDCDSLGTIDDFSGKSSTIPTTIRALDSLIDTGLIGRVDLLKLDVEGMEVRVLYGYRSFIAIHRPAILIEVLTEGTAIELNSFFREFSGIPFLYFNIGEDGTVKQQPSIRKSLTYNILLCSESQASSLGLEF